MEKRNPNQNSALVVFVLVFWLLVFSTFSLASVEARKNKSKKKQRDYGIGAKSNIFSILSFGAKADGISDDSKALVTAWKAACKVPGAILQIPSEFKFLIKPITLQGPCMPHLVFQVSLSQPSTTDPDHVGLTCAEIDGMLKAPPKAGSWPKSSLFQWLNVKWIHNFTIQGSGTIDGQGNNWWSPSQMQKRSKHLPDMKPTALRFYASEDVLIRDIKLINSPQVHLKFDNSKGVKIKNVTVSAPGNSPNTDGIHLQNTRDVEIHHSNIGTGDDCVSIQTGCSNVHIHHVHCGPGHGISIGGLGKDKSVACVSDILVENITLENTLYGARVKTWQGGLGSVKNVTFSNIQVRDVNFPMVIDQYYCDKHKCMNQTGAVAISGVKFNKIIGTYSTQPIYLACSIDIPCTDVNLFDVQLKPSEGYREFQLQQGLCSNSYGTSRAPLVPSTMDYCLRKDGGGSIQRIARSHDKSC